MIGRGIAWAERNAMLVMLLAAAGVVLATLVAPFLFGQDLWLSLVAGREIAERGLPENNTLTVFGNGREWVDQQWLAHVALYSAERVGGLPLVSLTGIALVLLTFVLACAAARWRGASERATVLVALLALLSAPWSYVVRAQLLALPLFVAVVWLLLDARNGVRPRTFLIVPIALMWANVHGSVVIAVVLTAWLAVVDIAKRRRHALPFALLLPSLVAAAVFVTPFGPIDTLDYYRLVLVDPPFADLVTEWRRTEPNLLTAPFYFLGVTTVAIVAWQRRHLSVFELGALALTLAGALLAVRGVVWFVLLALVLLPVAIDAALRVRDRPVDRRLNRTVALVSMAAVVCAGGSLTVRGNDWLESEWPAEILPAVRQATVSPDTRVWATDRTADWLLWHEPRLSGRIAYDVRFELLTRNEIEAVARYNSMTGSRWKDIADAYDVVVVDTGDDAPSQLAAYLDEPGTRIIARGDGTSVVARRNRSPQSLDPNGKRPHAFRSPYRRN